VLTVVGIVVGLLFVAGLVGSVLPWLPGPLLILAGALLWAFATDFETLGWGRLALLAGLTAASAVLGFLAAALGARRYGASRWGVAGALVGAVAGIFFGPLGLLIGCMAGAGVGELLRGADLAGSLRSGVGAVVGLLAGLVADVVVCVTMIGLFVYWVWSS
jgi:uncharacterized protein YqgC (DUF456 family)